MSALSWLMLANVVFWIGLAGYVVVLANAQNRINQRLQQLELDQRECSHD